MKIVFFIFFKGSGEFFTINNGLKYKAEGQKAGCCILWKLYKLVIPSGNMFHVQRRPEACTFLKEKKFQFSVSFSMKNWDSIFSSEETISDVTHLVVMKGNEKRKNFFISHYSRRSCKHSMSILLFLGVQL